MYFAKPGKDNTVQTIELAVQAARSEGIKNIVVASFTGYTAKYLKEAAQSGLNIIVVTHVNGFKEPGVQEMSLDIRQELESYGMKIVTTTHVLSGAERGISKRFSGAYPVEIIAHTLRMFGSGTKVCVECAVMALDCGAIPVGSTVCIAGSSHGADTCWILRPAHAQDILATKLDKLICKPI